LAEIVKTLVPLALDEVGLFVEVLAEKFPHISDDGLI
jgi:hypothetical protein